MSKTRKERRLAAIMFTDIVGYTALMQRDERQAAAQRAKHRQVFTETHQRHGGTILQYFGDGTLSTFPSGVEAVACAVAIQQVLNAPDGIPLRIGIHIGDIVFDGTEVYGDGVNVAARIESMGVPGGVLISGKLNDELTNQQHLTTTSLGHFQLKNITQPLSVFAVVSSGLVVPQRNDLKGKRSVARQTVAVLPFSNRSRQEEDEYLSDGMTEEIINALSKIKPLKVTSRTSSFYYKNKQVTLPEIGRQLEVAYILEGSVQVAGNKMRIAVTLVDAQEDVPLWSHSLDRSLDDIFAVQDEVSLLVADRLREHIGHFDIDEQLVPQLPVTVDNYKRYLRARYHLLKMSAPEIERGMEMLREIVADQPDFPLAHLGLHLGYTLMGTLGIMPAPAAFAAGGPFLERAMTLDDSLPEIQLHRSYQSFLQDWDLPQAYEHLQRSFERRPTVEYYQSMTSYLVAEGKLRAAHHYIDTALQIDPFSDINHHLKGFLFYVQEQYPAAIQYFEKSLALKPDAHVSLPELGRSLLLAGHTQRAREFFRELPLPDDDLLKVSGETMFYALTAPEQALEGLEKLTAALDGALIDQALNYLTLCHALLGNTEKTLQLLEQGINARLPMVVYTQIDPILKPIRALPEFQGLSARIFGSDPVLDTPQNKYKKNLLSSEEIDRYKQQLTKLMERDAPYLDAELSLRNLADRMELPPNYLSQLLNAGFGQNFAEYVNTYRLEYFKSRLGDPAFQHLTLLGLAYESGFNSKTSFNTFFKKATGTTPAAYRKQQLNE
ncbi:helix-turn-helix domain-containing protein [Lewinella sp. W8]|uniref:helix-turn-helix domain-containing protein n=1 Tax=Lewinella sp. W8 TaxID=2528208 RepID=UPI001068B3B7|nr:helix-turn-helix domain-containing protein [Lewinella sp. W8]MTB51015.1 helix-turn-helix domain-containing protein [Lewinella sp. W8]